jgi:glycosyltransferase involved in cell wall biosynthesis
MVRRAEFVSWATESSVLCTGHRFVDEFGMHLFARGLRAIRLEGWLVAPLLQEDTAQEMAADRKSLYHLLSGDLLESIRASPNIHRLNIELAMTSPPQFYPRWNVRSSIPRLLVMPFDSAGSGYYRAHLPAQALRRAGLAQTFVLPAHDSGFAPSAGQLIVSSVDAILAHNPFHDYQLAALEQYRAFGRAKIVIGLDDLLTQLPSYNPFSTSIYGDIESRIERALKLADLVVFATKPLQSTLRRFCRASMVIPNFLDHQTWESLPTYRNSNLPLAKSKPRIGWAGAPQHSEDLELLREAYRATYRLADWFFLGARPWFAVDPFCTFFPMTHPMAYPEKLSALNLDLGVAPLIDNPFNRAKGNQKVLEYLTCGMEVIAADLAPYRGLNVEMVQCDSRAWTQKIEAWLFRFEKSESSIARSKAQQTYTLNTYSTINPNYVGAWLEAISS